ncbi:hypothetical protein [Endozoicomonas sp.]|uniref:hypothetical protein n=1 Tax=Endozoicomonas sp. TaxID=1892382 RepID=UPI00383B9FA1
MTLNNINNRVYIDKLNLIAISVCPEQIPIEMKPIIRVTLTCLLPILLAISVPWYREGEDSGTYRFIDGLPDWVAVALFCYTLIPLINIFIWATCSSDSEQDQ